MVINVIKHTINTIKSHLLAKLNKSITYPANLFLELLSVNK